MEKLVSASESGCSGAKDQQMVLNSVRLLTRILPYIFEDPDWRGFFWSTLPGQSVRLIVMGRGFTGGQLFVLFPKGSYMKLVDGKI